MWWPEEMWVLNRPKLAVCYLLKGSWWGACWWRSFLSGSSHAYAVRLAGTAGSFKSTEEVYRIKFELFEEFCPFWFLNIPASLKHVTNKSILMFTMLSNWMKFVEHTKQLVSFLNTRIPQKLPSIMIWPWKLVWNAGSVCMCVYSASVVHCSLFTDLQANY